MDTEVVLKIVYVLLFIIVFPCIAILDYKKKNREKLKKDEVNSDNDDKSEEMYTNMLKSIDLDNLERLRKNATDEENYNNKQVLKMVIGMVSGGLIFFALAFYLSTVLTAPAFSAIIPITFVILMIILSIKPKTNKKSDIENIKIYEKQYEDTIIPAFLNQFEEKITYMADKKIDKKIYLEAEFEKFDSYFSGDVMEGTLKNNSNITMSEIKTGLKRTNSDGEVYYETLFNGIFTIIDIQKPFNEIIYLKKDRKQNIIHKIEKVELDSSEFESYFDIYSTNKIIAMQLLTSDVMHFLVGFQKTTGIDFELTIKNNKIYIRFFSGKIFERANITESYIQKEKIKKYYQIMNFVLDFSYIITGLINSTEY